MTENQTPTAAPTIPLYRHNARPEWGLGMLAWEHLDRRGYQFADGTLRVLKSGYYHLLVEVENPDDSIRQKLATLCRRTDSGPIANAPRASKAPRFSAQIALFRSHYPNAFTDGTWLDKQRGRDVKQRLKRHRDAAIAQAQELFAKEALEEVMREQRYNEVVQRMVALFDETDLVGSKHMRPLYALPATRHQALAEAVFEMLYGDGELVSRFDGLVRALTSQECLPSWQLTTALAGLVHPDQHICVRPKSFSAQAEVHGWSFRVERRPNGRGYERLLDLGRTMFVQLESLGLRAHDLMDVYDFMWATLRPSAYAMLGRVVSAEPLVDAGESDGDDAPGEGEAGAGETASAKPDKPDDYQHAAA
jgi:hypothetical protein